MTSIAISSGHGLYVRGASGDPVPPQLDEVDEARRVVNRVAQYLAVVGDVSVFHDNTSTTQSENLDTIVDWHNRQLRDYDVSVHFNCYDHSAHGTEVLYVTQEQLAARMSEAICIAGEFTNRGAKYRSDLAFLNGTAKPAILIETCFCDNTGDSQKYKAHFEEICRNIAETLSGRTISVPPTEPPPPEAAFHTRGKCSTFGGPDDDGVSPSEGLAFIYDYDAARHLFLPEQPPGTTGLARRLNPGVFYVACRWDYNVTPKTALGNPSVQALVRTEDQEFLAWPADWGPNENTGRVADLSPALADALNLETDDEVEVIYPAP